MVSNVVVDDEFDPEEGFVVRPSSAGRMALLGVLVRAVIIVVAAAAAVSGSGLPVPGYDGLAIGFYHETCPQAEDLVLAEMREIVQEDRTLAPALLRFMLHDCFVRVRASRARSLPQFLIMSRGVAGTNPRASMSRRRGACC